MKVISTEIFIRIGGTLRYLIHVPRVNSPFRGKDYVEANITGLLKHIDDQDMPVSKNSLDQLRAYLLKFKDVDESYMMTGEDLTELTEIVGKIEHVVFSEARRMIGFFVTDKLLDKDKLLLDVGAFFEKGVYNKLNSIAQFDFREAGYCISFERPTAAAFHVLRGTEEVLRNYYLYIVKRKRLKTMLWGKIINQLRERKTDPPDELLLTNLETIKDNYRNPTNHPEMVYQIGNVQDLFILCVGVVNRMMNDIDRREGSK